MYVVPFRNAVGSRCCPIGAATQMLRRHRPFSTQRYTFAIAREVPTSFSKAVTKFADHGPIVLSRAQQQLDRYLVTLRKFVPTLSLPALNEHADSVFVEDTVIAIGRKAVITNPGHPSRRGEVDTVRDVLLRLGFDTVDMRKYPMAFCDGGDVLYTGRHLFVGISDRTNEQALQVLANALEREVTTVPFEGNALHLKSIVTHMDETTLLAPTGSLGDEVLEAMNVDKLGYNVVRLPSMLACNVVAVNGNVLAQNTGCAKSKELLKKAAQQRGMNIEFLDFSEFAKCDGALTCCSVLLQL